MAQTFATSELFPILLLVVSFCSLVLVRAAVKTRRLQERWELEAQPRQLHQMSRAGCSVNKLAGIAPTCIGRNPKKFHRE